MTTITCDSKERAKACKFHVCKRCSHAVSPEVAKKIAKTAKYAAKIRARAS